MKKEDLAINNLRIVLGALKRNAIDTCDSFERLGFIELIHDALHQLGEGCDDTNCDGASASIVQRFIEHCT